ncbi:2'-5'-oligoadenylate synthase-like protein 2 [Suncus etruscus]|uniref:2'-5'-oligoadenylate synthase-like protein 2 n=1 Tax=Suncus etruscus TaxID=109475 RepID=UPI0021108410|nr:2'-5'-oligoadenylate synthase-like protein 2 [Suncus etruscus]XP_049623851.1 2'-5'-oligoadenylate synthase-like protein 2 [Suncus etruscus]
MENLYETLADDLDAFVEKSLQPDGEWKWEVQDAWNRCAKFLKDHCFQNELVANQEVQVLKVVKAGSSGKGTTLNHTSDVDMVLFLSCFRSFQEQADLREDIIDFITEKVDHCSQSLAYNLTVVQHRWGSRAPRSLAIQVQAKKNSDVIKVDVLPAFDVLENAPPDSRPPQEVYQKLITCDHLPGEFSPSFVVLQRHFVKSRPVKLKNLLRLVKHWWYQQHLRYKYQKVALPPKYALELLTIYAWEMGTDESESFDLANGFRTVMKLLKEYSNICIYWTKYYNFENEVVNVFLRQQLKAKRPVILDPTDPTNNVGSGKRWDVMAKEADYCLRQACCRSVQGWNVQAARDVSVKVKVSGEAAQTFLVDPYRPIWKMKREIRERWGLDGQLRLSFQEPGGERKSLSNSRTLAYHGLFAKVSISVLEAQPGQIQVFVKHPGGLTKPYAVSPEDSIYDLKEKISLAGGPPEKEQILKFPGHKVWNSSVLADLDVRDGDTLTLLRKSD